MFVLDYRNGPDELRRKNDGGLVEQIGEVAQVIPIGDDMVVLEHLARPDDFVESRTPRQRQDCR